MKIQVVIGANWGDEGKGMVSGILAREANKRNEKVLTVFYNGTMQRAHTFEGEIHRAMAAGTKYGSDTFYHPMFVVDPISLLILQAKPIVDPRCRVILPHDVMVNREKERKRGKKRHGSCGFGLFEAVSRSRDKHQLITVKDLSDPYDLYQRLKKINENYPVEYDDVYNLDIFMKAIGYLTGNCRVALFEDAVKEYDAVIFEGGQGLALDQLNLGQFPNLTPSSTGSRNFRDWVKGKKLPIELYYVSRSYLTRHGAGVLPGECEKDGICKDIVDETNQPNEFQEELRFGKIDEETFRNRINDDITSSWKKEIIHSVNLVFTQMNYTNGKIETTDGRKELEEFDTEYADHLFVSDQKDQMIKMF